MSESVAEGPGFFGKVRTHGDFVSRRLPTEFLTPWDECLQQGMLFAQQLFGAQWLPVYLNAPVWCFALGPHVYGPGAWAGVLMPGVDRVGRYFPFTIAAAVEGADLAGWLREARGWYDRVTELALSTLAADFALERFDADLLATRLFGDVREATPWRLATPEIEDVFEDLLAKGAARNHGVWWSQGSVAVPASMRAATGAMDARRFASLLDLGSQGWEWVVELSNA